jgi:hypothetical protein
MEARVQAKWGERSAPFGLEALPGGGPGGDVAGVGPGAAQREALGKLVAAGVGKEGEEPRRHGEANDLVQDDNAAIARVRGGKQRQGRDERELRGQGCGVKGVLADDRVLETEERPGGRRKQAGEERSKIPGGERHGHQQPGQQGDGESQRRVRAGGAHGVGIYPEASSQE